MYNPTNTATKHVTNPHSRQPANTRIGPKRVHLVRTRGGNRKFRALRLDTGNFSWGSEAITRKTRVIGVVYHPCTIWHIGAREDLRQD